MTAPTMLIIKEPKLSTYHFLWRVILEDGLYQLQRYSKEYSTWVSVNHCQTEEEPIKLYDQLEII